MSDEGKQKLDDLTRITNRLRESLALPPGSVARDSAILRFELAFEVAWKAVQYFARKQGFEVYSPRQAFERAFLLGWITDEVLWEQMIAARNNAVHVYHEALADRLHSSLPGYLHAIEELERNLRKVR